MRLSFRVEIQPSLTQKKIMLQHAGNARWAYNWGLQRSIESYKKWTKAGKPKKWDWSNAISLHCELNLLKRASIEDGGVPWMYEASKCAPQEALRDLDRAFKNMRAGRAKFPKFKSRKKGIGGFRLTGTIRVTARSIQLPVIGRVRLKPGERGYIPDGEYSQASVMEEAGRWFVSITPKDDAKEQNIKGEEVGIDLGVVRLATLSNGVIIKNPRALQKGQRKIIKLQKSLSRKKKGSSNRQKARIVLGRAHRRVRNLRKDSFHKATTLIAKKYGRVVIEDLNVKNMTSSGGARKRGLNRVILDASFGEFRRQLEYKGRLHGCDVVAVSPQYTSQRCSVCGHTERENRKIQSNFACCACGHAENADLNAAKNIRVAGSCADTKNACGGGVRLGFVKHSPVKQESAVSNDSV